MHTLSNACREKLEAEANYGTGRLLFGGENFLEDLKEIDLSLKNITNIKKKYGNSITATLWRAVESLDDEVLMAYICPKNALFTDVKLANNEAESYLVKSKEFSRRFSHIDKKQIKKILESYVNPHRRYNSGEEYITLKDTNQDSHTFLFQTIFNCMTT